MSCPSNSIDPDDGIEEPDDAAGEGRLPAARLPDEAEGLARA